MTDVEINRRMKQSLGIQTGFGEFLSRSNIQKHICRKRMFAETENL